MKRPCIQRGKAMDERLSAPDIVRFMSFVEFASDCWLWTGCSDYRGYGQLKVKGRAFWAHRLAFVLFNGPLPDGVVVHHTCHCASCVNPDHLKIATVSENCREAAHYRWGQSG